MIEQQLTEEARVSVEQVNEAFALFRSREGWQSTVENFHSSYRGTFPSLADYGRQLVIDLQLQQDCLDGLPDWLTPYLQLDYDALARDDLRRGGEVVEGLTGLHVFQPSQILPWNPQRPMRKRIECLILR